MDPRLFQAYLVELEAHEIGPDTDCAVTGREASYADSIFCALQAIEKGFSPESAFSRGARLASWNMLALLLTRDAGQ